MSIYLIPIETAIILFPLIAAVITIPYIIHQYRTYGAMLPLRVLIVYSFIFYLLCAYFLVLLPLPPIEEVANYTTPTMQLIPFESLREFTMSTSLVWNDPSTYITALNQPSLFLILFNIILTIPFGIFLRYYFKFTWQKTLLLSFLLSLSFELLQLSALLGIYPRPYRIFDVDDLITNTLGGMIGFGITPIFAHFLPSRKDLDHKAYTKGEHVSALRRVFAFFIDIFILIFSVASTLFLMLLCAIPYDKKLVFIIWILYVLLYFIIIPVLSKGKTLGKATVKIRLLQKDNQQPTWYHYLSHFLPLYISVVPTPFLIFELFLYFLQSTQAIRYLTIVTMLLLGICYFITTFQLMKTLFRKEKYPWYDRYNQLHNISTVINNKEVPSKDEKSIEDDSEASNIREITDIKEDIETQPLNINDEEPS